MPNRIDPTAVNVTVARQTPKSDFGDVLARTVNGMARMGGAIINSVGGMPVVSAAVSAITSLAGAGGRSPAQLGTAGQAAIPVASVPGAGGGSAGGGSIGTSGFAGLGGGRSDNYGGSAVLESMHLASMESLNLQMAMQQESREYNAISNVIKVRHDSAKAAINNIR